MSNCKDCIFYMEPSHYAESGESLGGPICGMGKGPLFMPTYNPGQNNALRDARAESCESYNTGDRESRVDPASIEKLNGVITMVPDPMALDRIDTTGEAAVLVRSCLQCRFYIPPETMVEHGLWNIGACAARGILLRRSSVVSTARRCPGRSIGPRDETSLSRMQLVPEYTMSTIGELTMAADFAREARATFSEPSTYMSDAPVTDDERAAGIRAWRNVKDENEQHEIMLPIFDPDFFSEEERAAIPRTGDDEHPEQYVDHMGLVYKTAVLWMALDETPALWGAAGTGKGHPLSTSVLTPEGWRKVGELVVGDEVIGSNGKATKVTGIFPRGVLPVNKVTMTDGSSVVVDDDHLWQTWTAKQEVNWRTGEKRINPKGSVLSTRELVARGLKHNVNGAGYKFRIPMVEPVEYEPVDLPLDPYALGVLLANGSLTSGKSMFSTNDLDVVNEVRNRGIEVFEATPTPTLRWRMPSTWAAMKELELAGEKSRGKFIPEVYLRGSVQQRRDLLAALLDCDGSCNGGHTRYHTMSQALADGVRELVQSLGGTASVQYSSRDDEMTVNIAMPVNPFRTTRKAEAWDSVSHRAPSRRIKSIEPVGTEDVRCITVEAEDHLYVTEDYIVTHNTEFFRHMAWLMCLPFHRISVTGSTEVDDLAGKMHYDPAKGTYFEYGRVPTAWGKPGVICLDEPNVGQPDVWQFIRPLTDNSKQLVLDMNKGERLPRHDYAFLGMAMNPAWDVRNSGTSTIADADGSRLMHIFVDLPSEAVERRIIEAAVKLDGWEIGGDALDMVIGIAGDLRRMSSEETIPITWGIRPQLKVARALKWFGPTDAYRLATADYLEPQHQELILDVVRSHARSSGMSSPRRRSTSTTVRTRERDDAHPLARPVHTTTTARPI